MEGFVNTTNVSPFDYGLKHSSRYANYGVDKIETKPEQREEQTPPQNNTLGTNKLIGLSYDSFNNFTDNITTNITDNIDKVIVDPVTDDSQNDVHHRLRKAVVIGTSAIGVGALTMLFARGKGAKKTVKALGNIIDNANIKIEELKQKPSMSKVEGYYLSFLQKTNNLVSRIRGTIFNFTPLKDSLFANLVKNRLGLKKPCDAITNGFRKLSFSTVTSAYEKAGKNVDNLTNLFAETNTRIASGEFGAERKAPKEVLDLLEATTNKIRTSFVSSFSKSQLDKRNEALIKQFEGLDEKVYDSVYGKLKDFVSDMDEWTTFIPEKLVAKDKARIMQELAKKKQVITNSPQDNYDSMSEIITKLEGAINPTDKSSRNAVKNLRALCEKYIKLSGSLEGSNRTRVVKLMEHHLTQAEKLANSEAYPNETSKTINTLVRQYREILNSDKKGAIEELLTQYKQYLPEGEYLKLKAEAQKTIKTINKAVHQEGFEYVDKARDLAAGSALTDVAIGMTLPLATTSLAMASAKTKEKKRSVVLRYGLPLLAGVATSTIATLKLISGGKALMFASAVSIVCNNLLEKVDNYLIERDKL